MSDNQPLGRMSTEIDLTKVSRQPTWVVTVRRNGPMEEVEREALARDYAELLGVMPELQCHDKWENWKDQRLPQPNFRTDSLVESFLALGHIVRDMQPFDCPMWDCYSRKKGALWCVLFMVPEYGGYRQGDRFDDSLPNVAAIRSAISALRLIGRKSADLKQAVQEAPQAPAAGGPHPEGEAGQQPAR